MASVPVDHGVPLGRGVLLGREGSHDVVPFWQMLPPGVQAWLATQLLQVPLAQWRFVPHDVPLASAVPRSVQTGAPVEHTRFPF